MCKEQQLKRQAPESTVFQEKTVQEQILQPQMYQPGKVQTSHQQIGRETVMREGVSASMMSQRQQDAKTKKERRLIAQQQKEEELRQWAEERTLKGGIVPGATVEQVRRYGSASTQQTVSNEEAARAVEMSGGFLYAKDLGNGCSELRPTLPKTVKVQGAKVELRRSYNFAVRTLARIIVDENGNFSPDAEAQVNHYLSGMQSHVVAADYASRLGEGMGGTPEAQKAAENLAKISRVTTLTILPTEILTSVDDLVDRVKRLGDFSSEGMQARLRRIQQKMLEDNGGQPLTPEQIQELGLIPLMYADAHQALKELASLRNLDLDDPDVPLPNACSANAAFQQMLRPFAGKEEQKRMLYVTASHFEEHKAEHLHEIMAHIEDIMRGLPDLRSDEDRQAFRDEMKRCMEKVDNGQELLPKEMKKINDILGNSEISSCKYVYHQAGIVGVEHTEEESVVYTVETFAAESKQYLVSPFSQHGAVGRYRGNFTAEGSSELTGHQGMDAYYNLDNPLPTPIEYAMSQVKRKMQSGEYPD